MSFVEADKSTLSNYRDIHTEHAVLTWTIDWSKQLVHGSVEHTMIVKQSGLKHVVFDTSFLDIASVKVAGKDAKWTLAERKGTMGSALTVDLPAVKETDHVKILIAYSTTSQCTALGWLTEGQTGPKKHAFVYSQCQAIHARSLLPCQDTPAHKFTYSASVTSSAPVLLSALRVSPPESDVNELGKEITYSFDQPTRVPSYLIAIASGDLAFKKTGNRTGVWADPTELQAAAWEFEEDIETFLETAESLTSSTYQWSTYSVLVLPKSFPFGGMENPQQTFVTPTLLAGDRSLVDVVAHEASHSWFGNNITCSSWRSFWLNEGWTTYLERLIVGRLHGEPARSFSYIIGATALQKSLQEMRSEPRYQRLVVEYKEGEDPDSAFSSIPYDKGSNLLLHLERKVGGLDVFLPYMADYFATFKNTSLSTEDWRAHLYRYFSKHGGDEAIAKLDAVDWQSWLHGVEMPKMEYDTSLADAAFALAARWSKAQQDGTSSFGPDDLKAFNANQTVVFLERLETHPKLSDEIIHKIDELYKFTQTSNAEIALRWFLVTLKAGLYLQEAADWVTDKGRMKFCRPIYRGLAKNDLELARRTFLEHEAFYHAIAVAQIKKDLGLK
ncbi:uncharacterized protein L969DRAFT_100748 [Mixia osmundae IAM 14324]|uniref:Peptidase M1 leukotriene A4 hydrolase/aminopeptidase C-terminal domain-containing protein n=1 Tax=Mixia osmundae (strain CBS 9802 / IAM 14324 / JCM 22182 / KY 12970) TaxID=764103 RepID=G7E091_MIXOS|nr:uncharacterized protein L969DRAFT_100748 [Mixia osmundae IAM 14324]KEI42241.1 hypothetical protein L969DRAFT_100748 [Mixia osmundae IAM 14324]GAA96251.1 hypothetical protein E5Q_02915 [Mixia osmundae IAM 14324]